MNKSQITFSFHSHTFILAKYHQYGPYFQNIRNISFQAQLPFSSCGHTFITSMNHIVIITAYSPPIVMAL